MQNTKFRTGLQDKYTCVSREDALHGINTNRENTGEKYRRYVLAM